MNGDYQVLVAIAQWVWVDWAEFVAIKRVKIELFAEHYGDCVGHKTRWCNLMLLDR